MTIEIIDLTINKTPIPISIDIFKALDVEITISDDADSACIMIHGISFPLMDRGSNKWGTVRRIPCMNIGAYSEALDVEAFVGRTDDSGYKKYSDALTITADAGSRYITDKYNKILERFKELAESSEYFDDINTWELGYSLRAVNDLEFPVLHIPRLRNIISPRFAGSRKRGTVTNSIVMDIMVYDKAISGDSTRINRIAERIETFFNKYRSLDSFYGIRIAKVTEIELSYNSDSLGGGGLYELGVQVYIDFPSIRGYIIQ